MEKVTMDYKAKTGATVSLTLTGGDVSALHEAAQCIRGGKFRLWHDDERDDYCLWGRTPTGHRFESVSLHMAYGEGDRLLRIEGHLEVL